LFLFSQHMRGGSPAPDAQAEQGESQRHPAAPLPENNPAELSTLQADAEPAEDLPQASPDVRLKAEAKSTESTAEPADKADSAEPIKTQPQQAATDELFSRLPLSEDDKLPENNPAPRTLHGSSYAAPPASPIVQPSSEAQSAALPLRSGQFSELLSQRVMWLSSQNLQAAQIELSPKELGTLQVHVVLADGEAKVHFASQHAEVRGVLEGQLYRLQAMLENQGLPTPRLEVLDASFSQHKEQSSKQPSRSSSKPNDKLKAQGSAALSSASNQNLIDYYA